jgi:hypothetical protein
MTTGLPEKDINSLNDRAQLLDMKEKALTAFPSSHQTSAEISSRIRDTGKSFVLGLNDQFVNCIDDKLVPLWDHLLEVSVHEE